MSNETQIITRKKGFYKCILASGERWLEWNEYYFQWPHSELAVFDGEIDYIDESSFLKKADYHKLISKS